MCAPPRASVMVFRARPLVGNSPRLGTSGAGPPEPAPTQANSGGSRGPAQAAVARATRPEDSESESGAIANLRAVIGPGGTAAPAVLHPAGASGGSWPALQGPACSGCGCRLSGSDPYLAFQVAVTAPAVSVADPSHEKDYNPHNSKPNPDGRCTAPRGRHAGKAWIPRPPPPPPPPPPRDREPV